MSKALGLLSGGLDSSLAALTLKRQGVDVTCVAFVTPFFGAAKARKAAAALEIPLIVRDIADIHLEMVKSPRYGYGKNLNPCIDCHAMMFRLAGEIMVEEGFDFLFSGEVLGQRPMSQNLSALTTVANYSGHPERILRPMSARLLPITAMEEEGLVDRQQLNDIQGRSRRPQQLLARQMGLKSYPAPGGGCLLTEKSFTGRLRDLFTHNPLCTPADVELLKLGRQFRLSPTTKLVLGRHQESNEAIQALAGPKDIVLHVQGFPGPVGLVSGCAEDFDLLRAGGIVASYGKGQELPEVEIGLVQGGKIWSLQVAPMERNSSNLLLVD
jgi:hypothetical protein